MHSKTYLHSHRILDRHKTQHFPTLLPTKPCHALPIHHHPRRCAPTTHGLLDWISGSSGTSEEEGSLVPLDQLPPEAHGPLAVLLSGFVAGEVDAFKRMMVDTLEADMVKIVCVAPSMLTGTLQQALDSPGDAPFVQPAIGAPRVVILSGMFPEEVGIMLEAYAQAGLPRTVWATAVPNNLQRTLGGLLEEVCEEDRIMMEMQEQQD